MVYICHEQRWGQLRWPNVQALPEWEGRIGSVSRCRWCTATATFCWQSMCVVCAREKEGRLMGLCLLFYELGLYVGFLWGRAPLIVPELASSVIPTSARTRGPAPLNAVLVVCHRFKRTQHNTLCLPEIFISEYMLSWPACTDKPPEPGVGPRPSEPGGHTGQAHCSEWLTPLRHRGRPNTRLNITIHNMVHVVTWYMLLVLPSSPFSNMPLSDVHRLGVQLATDQLPQRSVAVAKYSTVIMCH